MKTHGTCMNTVKYPNSCWFSHTKNNDPVIKCKYCTKSFNAKKDVVIHQKENHEENMQLCKNYVKKSCKFKSKCWFLHVNHKSDEPSVNTSENSKEDSSIVESEED